MTLQKTITNEIKYAESLLDLCAGPGRWTKHCNATKTAVELNPKYVKQLRNNGYSNVMVENVCDINYTNGDKFDVTLWIDGIEHLEKNDALAALREAERHTHKMLVFTPNEFINNENSATKLDEPLQKHLSVFPTEFWLARGYKIIYKEYNSTAKVNNLLYKKVFK